MSATTVLAVAGGAALGAPARYLLDRGIQSFTGAGLPWGTFVVNVTGSLVLGVLVGATSATTVPDVLVALVGTGFCGAFTTYSTFGYETWRLLDDRRYAAALGNAVGSVVAGLGAAAAGFAAAVALLS